MEYLYQGLSKLIYGAAEDVFFYLGNGHFEKVYENALIIELEKRKLNVRKQVPLNVYYKEGQIIGTYIADLVVEDKIIIELKANSFVTKENYAQLLNYLKTTNYRLGLIINFGGKKLFVKRLIN